MKIVEAARVLTANGHEPLPGAVPGAAPGRLAEPHEARAARDGGVLAGVEQLAAGRHRAVQRLTRRAARVRCGNTENGGQSRRQLLLDDT